ncbi:MAG TPA: ubiquinol-cytochrome c reductase iron-sulfur subunit [Candidatus Dormibacteraeota bacterium]|jgi:menaquinol-cytochrome c reductase iron-sulfur subunit|nr:ubiquinol-cytochrome c reductase iron-sulfur subunit [Candidatus Dormibacteraeota bacterium]
MVEGTADSQPPSVKPLPSGSPDESRRSFLGVLLGLGAFFVGALLSVPLIRFALFPLLRRTTELKSSTVGDIRAFSSLSEPVMRTVQIEQVDGWRKAVSEKAVYVTKDGQGELRVLTSICPHLGCTVPWNKEKKQFICPCHGATFAADGTRVSGPSLRGMDSLETSVQDGQLLVQFQYFRQLLSDKEVIG